MGKRSRFFPTAQTIQDGHTQPFQQQEAGFCIRGWNSCTTHGDLSETSSKAMTRIEKMTWPTAAQGICGAGIEKGAGFTPITQTHDQAKGGGPAQADGAPFQVGLRRILLSRSAVMLSSWIHYALGARLKKLRLKNMRIGDALQARRSRRQSTQGTWRRKLTCHWRALPPS